MCSGRVFHDHNIKAIKPVYSFSNEYTKNVVTMNCTSLLILIVHLHLLHVQGWLWFSSNSFFYVANIRQTRLGLNLLAFRN